ncbi:HDOD domain-containing protein [Methyloversatilis thermotolerans]|uniref:HDOD domain-containing protein n=1 Tax=Methyloversatilis thermotolerans TaxID=1346290 RepID=UPI0003821D6A|nr:HDOD domain-containing protein [Methyloversatilis thermotolerans]
MNSPSDALADDVVLPPLPEVVAELIPMLGQEQVHGAQLARTVGRDPALAGATLKLANSSFFGLTGRVASMQDAITLIGVNAVRNMLLILGMRDALKPACGTVDVHDFWLHALETGAAARALARPHDACGDEAFLAGLLHDLGKLVQVCSYPDGFARISAQVAQSRCSWRQAESETDCPGHEACGAMLAHAWRLPPVLALVMSGHHMPDGDAPLLVHRVHLANLIAHVAIADQPGAEPAARLQAMSWQRLAPAESDIERAVTAVRRLRARAGEWRALLRDT